MKNQVSSEVNPAHLAAVSGDLCRIRFIQRGEAIRGLRPMVGYFWANVADAWHNSLRSRPGDSDCHFMNTVSHVKTIHAPSTEKTRVP